MHHQLRQASPGWYLDILVSQCMHKGYHTILYSLPCSVLKELVFGRPGLWFYHRWSHAVDGAELLLRVKRESL